MQKHTCLIRFGRNGRWLRLSWLLLLPLIIVLAGCGGGSQMLVAEYDRDGLLELFLLNEGDEESEWQSLGEELDHAFVFEEGSPAFFVPGTDHILITYVDDGDIIIEHLEIGDEAPNEIFEGDRTSLFGAYSADPFAVFLRERRDSDDMRCYVSLDGAEADRMARATNCFTTESGVIIIDRDDNETTLTAMDLDGDNETMLLDDVEDVDQIRWNADLSRAAYTQQDGNDVQLYVIERGEEEAVAVGDEFERILSLGFLGDGETVYYLAQEDEDEERMLFLSSREDAIAEEVIPFNIASSADGDYLAYLEESGSEVALMVQPANGEDTVEVLEADEISFYYLDSDPVRLLALGIEDDEYTLVSTAENGEEAIELFSDDDYELENLYYTPDGAAILTTLTNEDGISIWHSDIDEANGRFLVEEWRNVFLLNMKGDWLVFMGREDDNDDMLLYSVNLSSEGAELIELDDDVDETSRFTNVRFSQNARSVLYSVWEDGFEDVQIRQAPVNGEEAPTVLYDDVELIDVRWDGRADFRRLR